MKIINNLRIFRTSLLAILPVALFFSYQPVLSLASTPSMNLELSLAELCLALFALLSIPVAFRTLRRLGPLKSILLLLFPLYLTISLAWSSNFWRGFLTVGLFWCIVISLLALPQLIKTLDKTTFARIFLLASVLVAGFCWLQCFLDLLSLPRSVTLLCQGCTYQSFGFPHPNGFAIEPQFMGHLLLAPTFYALYLHYRQPSARTRALLIFFAATLFLTFSRGAIFSAALAYVVIFIVLLFRRRSPQSPRPLRFLRSLPLLLVAFLITLGAQGLMAQLSPTNTTFVDSVSASLDQLTLGRFSLTQSNATDTISNSEISAEANPEAPAETSSAAPHFSGYVTESTDVRVNLTNLALRTWSQSPQTILLGTGLGSAGTAMYHTDPGLGTSKEIVQNQYASLLLEGGLCAYLLLALALITLFILYRQRRKILNASSAPAKNPQTPENLKADAPTYLTALVLAYAGTLAFFSGLPNALHLYLLPPLAASLIFFVPLPAKDKHIVKHKV